MVKELEEVAKVETMDKIETVKSSLHKVFAPRTRHSQCEHLMGDPLHSPIQQTFDGTTTMMLRNILS